MGAPNKPASALAEITSLALGSGKYRPAGSMPRAMTRHIMPLFLRRPQLMGRVSDPARIFPFPRSAL